jgi:hypothetical protein
MTSADRSLDEEGVPDLQGPLPDKVATGDPQEGAAPPGDRPGASVDWGTTAEEQRAGEPMERKLRREVPDRPVADRDAVALVADDLHDDTESELIGEGTAVPAGQGLSAEEAAVRVEESPAATEADGEPPG